MSATRAAALHFEDVPNGLTAGVTSHFSLPTRDVRPYLNFERIAHRDGTAEAVFNGPNKTQYRLQPAQLNRAFQDEKEAALAGDLHFTLPHFQLAKHGFRNDRVDRAIRRIFG